MDVQFIVLRSVLKFILDLRHAPEGPVTTWLKGSEKFQVFGLTENETLLGSLSDEFAVIIHFQHTTPARVLGSQSIAPAQPVASHFSTAGKQTNYLWLSILAAAVLCIMLAGLTWMLVRRQRRRKSVSGR